MKRAVLLLLLLFVCTSCAEQNLGHSTYGKWESAEPQKIVLAFRNDNILEAKTFGANDYVQTEVYRYKIIGDKSIKIIDYTRQEYKLQIGTELTSDDEILLNCRQTVFPNGKTIIDFPAICNTVYKISKEQL